jgi:hypothetical protein
MKAFLAASVLALGGAVLWVGSGAVGPFISTVVAGFGGFVSQVGVVASSPKPTAAPEIPPGPTIDAPAQTATNQDTVNVTVNVPASVTGIEGYTVRLYVTLKGADPVILVEEDVGETAVQVLSQVKLSPGRNDFQAAVFGPGGESERSAIASWILDTSKPKISVISPKNNSKVAKSPVKVKGKSQAGAEIRLANANNNAVATTTAGADGLWTASIEVDNGGNVITVTATDPAGNQNSTTLNLRKGSGKLIAVLSASGYRFRASKLPRGITLRVAVTDPDGKRLAGARALFTVSVPGIEAIVSGEITTNGDGIATFQTNIPSGATKGSGLATVLVTTDSDGTITDRQVLTILE